MALVNQRLRGLCLEPQLLGELEVTISGGGGGSAAVVQRTRSLLGLLIACGRHVRKLDLDVRLAEDAPEQHRLEVAALVSSCLAACATAGQLQELRISEATPLGSTAWLQGLTNLHTLSALGECEGRLSVWQCMQCCTCARLAGRAWPVSCGLSAVGGCACLRHIKPPAQPSCTPYRTFQPDLPATSPFSQAVVSKCCSWRRVSAG